MRTELGGSPAGQQTAPIPLALERLQAVAVSVVERLNLLQDRLTPVLRQQTKIAGGGPADGKAPVAPASQATHELNRAHDTMRDAESMVNDLLSRLEV